MRISDWSSDVCSSDLSGDRPDWRPVRVFDDGVRTFIEFPESIARGEMPPVFVIGASGEGELVNYRVSGHYIIVDRLFAEAELRMGDKRSRSEEHTSEIQSLMRNSYAVLCLKKTKSKNN